MAPTFVTLLRQAPWTHSATTRSRGQTDPDDISPIDGLKAFALLAPTLESLTILRGRIIEQRGAEACDVTPAQAARPKIEETLELMRSRFNDIKKPKAQKAILKPSSKHSRLSLNGRRRSAR